MNIAFKTLFTAGAACAIVVSCAKAELEPAKPQEVEKNIITATVTLPSESISKVLYTENTAGGGSGLSSVWEAGDQIQAITDAGARVTFDLVEGEGTTTATFVAEAEGITNSTQWQAVIGSHVGDEGAAINCTYSGQDGTIANLGDYDFIVTSGTGTKPTFDFSTSGQRLSYFMRIKLPAGIKSLEYNADAYWSVTKDAITDQYYDNFNNVTEVVLPSVSASGEAVYIAISATAHHNRMDAAQKGIILTFFNSDKTQSYGKVLSSNFSSKGGKIGTADLTSMTLIDRVLPENALDFGSMGVTMQKDEAETVNAYNNLNDYTHSTTVATKWSPHNLFSDFTSPADRGAYVGGCFCWGEITPKTSFSEYNYDGTHEIGGIANFSNTQLGHKVTYQVSGPSGSGEMKLQHIAGTKYDAARVHWGVDWRMPTMEDLLMFVGSSNSVDLSTTTASGFTTENTSTYDPGCQDGKKMEGRTFTKNAVTIFFPSAGWNKKADWASTQYFYARGFYWSDTRIRATPSNGDLTNQPLSLEFQRGGAVRCGNTGSDPSKNMNKGLYIRPVINNLLRNEGSATAPGVVEDGANVPVVYPSSTLYGYIKDSSDNPIQGVVVTDGYSFCSSDKFGLYQMQANANARTVSITTPAGYELSSNFYQVLGAQVDGKWADKNFTLTARASTPTRATIIAITDEHLKDNTGITKFGTAVTDINSTATTLTTTGIPVGTPANAPAGAVVCISLGDQMWDDMSKASSIKTAFASISVPVFYTIGNHDYDNSQSTAYAAQGTFIQNFGPVNYSFDIANVHVIVMNDIYFTGNGSGTINHKCGFTQAEVDWLKADIARVSNSTNKIGVLCVHAPLSMANAGDSGTQNAVMSALKNNFKNVHVLSGHTHCVKNNLYHGWAAKSGRSIYEHTLQSLSGYFWEADVSFEEGSPAGYGVMTFDADDIYAEYNKVTKEAATFQMRVYDGGATYNKNSAWDEMMHGGSRGYKEFTWDSPAKSKCVVRLNDPGSSNDDVDTWSLSVYGSPMTRVTTPIKDACVASYVFNKLKGTHGDANGTTDHIWYSGSNFSSSFTVTATHTMGSGWKATYTSTHYVGTSYKGFAYGEAYD